MPQSLKIQNIESYQKQFEEELLCFADRENVNKRFMLGEKYPTDKALHTIMMQEKMCPENCEMVDYIRDKISGELNNRKIEDISPILYYIKVGKGTHEDYIFDWEEIQW